MYPKGIIYKIGDPSFGVKKLTASLRAQLLYQSVRGIASGLIAYAVIFFMFTYAPLLQQEILYSLGRIESIPEDTGSLSIARASDTAQVQQYASQLGVSSYFSVVIPKIGAKENIVANVDASDEKDYLEALQKGVAHAAGTYFPGQGKRIFLFSHSTDSPINFARYNAVFYLLSKLDEGDKIIVFFADKKYEYEVSTKQVVGAGDTSWIDDSGESEELVLQTCDPPGTTWKRLIVVAKPISQSAIDIPYGGI